MDKRAAKLKKQRKAKREAQKNVVVKQAKKRKNYLRKTLTYLTCGILAGALIAQWL